MLKSNFARKAVRYRRISGNSQRENFSLRNQDVRSARYCERKRLPLDRDFEEVASGLILKRRPSFRAMVEYVLDKDNKISDVVFNDIDRFARNYRDFFDYADQMVKAGITLHSVIDDEEYDYNSEEKWTDKAIAAQKESKRISRRVKEGQRIATELGYHIGKPPWGYMLEHETDEFDEEGYHAICGKLVRDPDLWPHVLDFWRRAVDGMTPMRLAQWLRMNNVPSPRGKPWTDDTARRIMQNAKYCGRLFRGVNPQSRIPGPQENAPPIFREDNHEAAVSAEDWQKVNDGIASRHKSRGPTRSHSSPNPLSQLTKCGNCAARGVPSNLEIYRYGDKVSLRCSRKKKMGADFCEFKSVNLKTLLAAITARIIHHFLTTERLQSVIDGVNEVSRSMLEDRQVQLARINERKKVVNTEINTLGDVLTQAREQKQNVPSLIRRLAGLRKGKCNP